MAHETYRQVVTALRAQLKELDAQREKIKHAIEAIEDLPAPPALDDAASGAEEKAAGGSPSSKTTDESPSYPEAGEIVLKEAGKALHLNEIMRRSQLRGWYADKDAEDRGFRNAMAGSLDRKYRGGEIFSKPAPATYGLLAWQNEGTPSADGAAEGA